MNDVRFREEEHAVAVRVAARVVNDANLLSVEMNGNGPVIRDDGEAHLRLGLDGPAQYVAGHGEAFSDVGVRNNVRIFAEYLIRPRMIAVPMRIDHECERFFCAEAPQRRFYLGGQGGEFIVDHQDAVFARGYADVPPSAGKHVHRPRNVGRFDLGLRDLRRRQMEEHGNGKREET